MVSCNLLSSIDIALFYLFIIYLCLLIRNIIKFLQIQMRHLFVIIDSSRSMEDQDLKPNRLTSTLKVSSTESMPSMEG